MDSSDRYVVVGQNGSPYSMKLRAVMRYRRLPFDWVLRTERNMGEFAAVKPLLMPMIRFPGETKWRSDSTPIIEELEQRHPGQRSVIPDSPGRAFLAYLIEDFADEWLTKAMFHYRWAYDADIQYASFWIADDFFPDQKGDARAAAAQRFAERQIERMPLVGCTPQNAPIIEATYTRSAGPARKLTSACTTTSLAVARPLPTLVCWASSKHWPPIRRPWRSCASVPNAPKAGRASSTMPPVWKASGIPTHVALPEATVGLLRLAAETYLPFLVANAAAIERGDEKFEVKLLGHTYVQAPFGYQRKCLAALRRAICRAERYRSGRNWSAIGRDGLPTILQPLREPAGRPAQLCLLFITLTDDIVTLLAQLHRAQPRMGDALPAVHKLGRRLQVHLHQRSLGALDAALGARVVFDTPAQQNRGATANGPGRLHPEKMKPGALTIGDIIQPRSL